MTGHLRARHRAVRHRRQDGLSLIEVMVALLMLSIVSISASVLFVSSLKTTTEQSVKQRAIAVATRSLETLSAVPVAKLVEGRSQSAVQTLLALPAIAALTTQDLPGPQLDPTTTLGTYDPSASGATEDEVVPIYSTETLDGTVYDVTTVINQCLLRVDASNEKICDSTGGAGAKRVYRATVNVTWGKADCGNRCGYSVSSLIDQRQDPEFQLADSVPIVQSVTPSSSARNNPKEIVIEGADFRDGAQVELEAAGGTITNVTQETATAKTLIKATWTPGPTIGAYTLTVVNPDNSRADYQLAVVDPYAVDDCTDSVFQAGTGGYNYYLIVFTDNDDPSTGGTPTFSNIGISATSAITADGRRYLYIYTKNEGTYTIDYASTIDGFTTNTTRMTFKVNAGSC